MRCKVNSDTPLIDGTLIVDVDGTLCALKTHEQSYSDVTPNLPLIEKLRHYQSKGYKILLFTSRNMKTYKGNLAEINKYTAPVLLEWLDKWRVPYDEILFGKPWPRKNGFYIDDRAIRPDEFLKLSEEEIHALLREK